MKRVRRRGSEDERGFTLVESVIALGLLFTVLLGLLGALTAGVRGVVLGRHRTMATAIANEVMEQARARAYGEIGHAITADPTIATDTQLALVDGHWSYGGERLAGSMVPGNNPPFTPHIWTRADGATTFSVSVYVTTVPAGAGKAHKRVTAIVSWPGGTQPLKLSSLVFDAEQPPDPLLKGVADADAGVVALGGTLIGPDVESAERRFGYAHGEIDSAFVKRVKGFGIGARSTLRMRNSGISTTGPSCVSAGLESSCGGVKAETISDNDAGTAPPDADSAAPTVSSASTISGGGVTMTTGEGATTSQSTVDSDDDVPYHRSAIGGPNSATTQLVSGSTASTLLRASGPCATSDRCASGTVDIVGSGDTRSVVSTARASLPALDLVDFEGAPSGYDGMVRVSATDVTTTAAAGPSVAVPTINATPVTVQMWDSVLDEEDWPVAGYRSFTFTPGNARSGSTHADLVIGNATISMDASFVARKGATSSQSGGGAVTHAESRLVDWLRVTIRLRIVQGEGATTDMTIDLDYGRISAVADYQPAA